jgi:hypothetical protein
MAQVIRVSKEGINVGTASSANDFVYLSDYNTLKYYTSGTINVVAAGTTAEGTVSHGLGYYPFFVAYVNKFVSPIDATLFSMCPGTFKGFPANYTFANAYASTASLFFQLNTNSASGTWTFKYFIFRNNLGL